MNVARISLQTLLVAALALIASAAHASGFDSARFGGELGGHAAAGTPFAVYYNPAALAATKRVHLAVDLTLALHSQGFNRAAADSPVPADARGANTGRASLFDVIGGPALAASMRFKDFAVGVGMFAPMSGTASFDGNSDFVGNERYPGAQDGVARWHIIEGTLSLGYLSSAASYTFASIGLSLGVGANLGYASVNVVRANAATLDDDLASEGRVHVETAGWVGSFSGGLMWEAVKEKLWLAASYQAPPGLYNGMVLRGNTRVEIGGSVSSTQVDLHQTLPDSVRMAMRYRPDSRYELRLSGDYMRWSMFRNQCISRRGAGCDVRADGSVPAGSRVVSNLSRDWQDAFGVRAGASYWFSPGWEGFVGVGYDSNAIPDATLEPSVMDGHDIAGALGLRLGFGSHLALALSYTHIYWLPRDTTGKSQLSEAKAPTRVPNAGGEYEQWAGIFNTFVELSFD